MKSNKICSKLRKGANFAAANLPLRPQKTTMTVLCGRWLKWKVERYWEKKLERKKKTEREKGREGEREEREDRRDGRTTV